VGNLERLLFVLVVLVVMLVLLFCSVLLLIFTWFFPFDCITHNIYFLFISFAVISLSVTRHIQVVVTRYGRHFTVPLFRNIGKLGHKTKIIEPNHV